MKLFFYPKVVCSRANIRGPELHATKDKIKSLFEGLLKNHYKFYIN